MRSRQWVDPKLGDASFRPLIALCAHDSRQDGFTWGLLTTCPVPSSGSTPAANHPSNRISGRQANTHRPVREVLGSAADDAAITSQQWPLLVGTDSTSQGRTPLEGQKGHMRHLRPQ